MDLRSPINIVAKREIYPDLIDDLWFTQDPVFARLRENIAPFSGGTFTAAPFRFRPMSATHYAPGATHTANKVQTIADSQFDMKFAQCSIPEFQEELEVYNRGENSNFSLLDEDLENGLASLTDLLSFDIWGDSLSDPTLPNGLAEMIADGVLPQWNSTVATTYGGVTRGGDVGSVLNGNIIWGGTQTGLLGDMNWPLMNYAYTRATHGAEEPDLIVTNKFGHSCAWAKLEPQFQYTESVTDPYWGGTGFKFRKAYVMVSEHCPSLVDGLSDADNYGLGNYLTGTINPNPVAVTKNFFPVVGNAATLSVGETYWGLNSRRLIFRVSDSPVYGFGFSGFMGTPDSEKVVGRIKVAYNYEGNGCKFHFTILGIGG